MNETFLTTNSAEGYNHGLASALPANSGTWTVIGRLQSEEALANLKLRDSLLGAQNNETTMNSARNTHNQLRRKELLSIVESYNIVSTDDYMKTVITFSITK